MPKDDVSTGTLKSPDTLWFVAKEKLLSGPFTFEQLLAELAEGRLDPGDYCWRQGFQEWRPLCGVEDFGFQVKPYVVRAYPQVIVPSAHVAEIPRVSGSSLSGPALNQKSSTLPNTGYKTVKVRLEPSRRHQVGLWERVGMVVFSIILAWAATWVALSEVTKNFDARFERHRSGQVVQLGEPLRSAPVFEPKPTQVHELSNRAPASVGQITPHANRNYWSFQQIAPVLAAPGLDAFENETWLVREMIQRPVGSPREFPKTGGAWSLASGHEVEWNATANGEVRFEHAADPIFIQPYELRGTWSVHSPKTLRIRALGDPRL